VTEKLAKKQHESRGQYSSQRAYKGSSNSLALWDEACMEASTRKNSTKNSPNPDVAPHQITP